MVKLIKQKMRAFCSKSRRKKVVQQLNEENHLEKCSIICSNCIGAILLHDLHLRFDSPTVNLWFEAADFVEFVENLEHYLSVPLTQVQMDTKLGYPVGYLEGKVKIYFQHFTSPEQAVEKWEARKKRVDIDNLFLICTDRDGMTKELLERYLQLPHKKIIFVSHKDMVLGEECIYVPGFENEASLPDMSSWADCKGHRYYEKYFDIVGWLNK